MKTLPFLVLSACAVDTAGIHPPMPDAGMSDADVHADAEVADANTPWDDAPTCSTFTYVLPDLAAGEQADVWLDLDQLPSADVQLCVAFATPNPASARVLHLGDDRLVGFGPCDGAFTTLRREHCTTVENTGRTLARLENSPPTSGDPPVAGCQLGDMRDVQIIIRCP